ncbi:hypothetical protein G9C85_03635 [Halorubellus sp. JP-L1]|uniref:hypothetical protein n=1 Tax=Halorubellus sp. JP-L1 TaxID=2715753 RepID=UPI001409E385|nr:hypothetical protein [Halorubellus sp. JP-L1]NHN40728.1 hypothetical protein [Halorubellus sp. JP-L1]
MSAEDAIREYYEALRRGEPLYPYFVESPDTWKAAISTTYDGYDAVAEGLREQSRTTEDWTVDSRGLSVVEAGEESRLAAVEGEPGCATFNDDVALAWTSTDGDDANGDGNDGGDESRTRHEHETRWSGTLVERGGEWLFLELHVSAAQAV